MTSLRWQGETKQGKRVKESIQADNQSTTQRAKAEDETIDETIRYKGVPKARTLVFSATALTLSLSSALATP